MSTDRRWWAAAATALLLCGCSSGPDTTGGADATPQQAVGGSEAPATAGPPSEAELGAGWDERPDGPPPVPDQELDDEALRELLRTGASDPDAPDRCRPDALTARLEGFDIALGHRFTFLRLTNASARTCVVGGVPGVGARGEWGNAFQLTVRPAIPTSPDPGPVPLAPGATASALVEWTGALPGSGDERASLLVFELAQGQPPLAVPAVMTGPGAPEDPTLDLGMLTTVKVAPFEPR